MPFAARLFTILAGCAALSLGQSPYVGKVAVPSALIEERLKEAGVAVTDGSLDDAISILERALAEMGRRTVRAADSRLVSGRAPSVEPGDRFVGADRTILRRLQALPEDGFDRYRRRAEARVQAEAPAAVAALRDRPDPLASVRRVRDLAWQAVLTDSGQRALLGLVDAFLERGEVEAARLAAYAFQPRFEEFGSPHLPALLARLGLALAACEDADGLALLRASLPDDQLATPVSVYGEEIPLAAFLDRWLARLGRREAAPAPAWPDVAIAAGEPAWSLALDSQRENTRSRSFRNDGFAFYVGWGQRVSPRTRHAAAIPTIADGVVYACDGLSLRARSLFNGDPIWPGAVRGPVRTYRGRFNRNVYYQPVVAGDLVLATLEGEPQTETHHHAEGGFRPIEAIARRRLVAVDRASGRVVWSHHRFSGATPEEGALLERLSVTTPPLVVGDSLFVGATEHRGGFHHWLLALDRRTGHLLWKTYICTGQAELNMFGNPILDATPGKVAEYRGVLYYSTNTGILAAVEGTTGAVRWLSAYEQVPIPQVVGPTLFQRYPGWKPDAPAFLGENLYVAPTDSYDLYQVDTRTGELTAIPTARRTLLNRNTWFLGLHGGMLVVAGDRLVGIDPTSHRMRWASERLGRDAQIGGQPAVLGDRIWYTTTTEGQTWLCEVSLESGRTLDRQRLARSVHSGHVVATPEAVAVAAQGQVEAFFELGRVEANLRQQLLAGGRQGDLLRRLGDVLRQREAWVEAQRTYDEAIRTAQEEGDGDARERAQRALYRLWWTLAQQPSVRVIGLPGNPIDRLLRAAATAPSAEEKARALLQAQIWAQRREEQALFAQLMQRVVAEHAEDRVEVDAELTAFVSVAQRGARLPAGFLALAGAATTFSEVGLDEDAVAAWQRILEIYGELDLGRLTAWDLATQGIANAIQQRGRQEVYGRQEREAGRMLRSARAAKDAGTLRRLLAIYPLSESAPQAQRELNALLMAAGRHREARVEMQRLFSRLGAEDPGGLALYALCLLETGSFESAAQVLRTLGSRAPRARIELPDGRRTPVLPWVKERLAALELPERSPRSKLPADLQPLWTHEGGAQEVVLVNVQGRAPASMKGRVLVRAGAEIQALDLRERRVAWSVAAPTLLEGSARWCDGTLVVLLGDRLVAVDPERGRPRWERTLDRARPLDLATAQGKVWVMVDPGLGRTGLSLRSFDLLTGEALDSRDLRGLRNAGLQTGDGHLLVVARDDRAAFALDAFTGETASARLDLSQASTLQPFLLEDSDRLVLVANEGYGAQARSRMQVRDLAARETSWSHPFSGEVIRAWSAHGRIHALVKQSRPFRTRLVTLDAETGRTVTELELHASETLTGAIATPDHLFLIIRRSSRRVRDAGKWVRALAATDHGRVLWDTPRMGARSDLEIVPVESGILLLKAAESAARRGRRGNVYRFDLESGRAVDQLPVGTVPQRRPRLLVTDGMVAALTEDGLKVYGK